MNTSKVLLVIIGMGGTLIFLTLAMNRLLNHKRLSAMIYATVAVIDLYALAMALHAI